MLAATHEERVANLEARLAELSQSVGSYDRLRQDDQGAIFRLKVLYFMFYISLMFIMFIFVDIHHKCCAPFLP